MLNSDCDIGVHRSEMETNNIKMKKARSSTWMGLL